jgi:hypothetical protein
MIYITPAILCYRTYILLLLHLYDIHLNCHSVATVRTHSYCPTCTIYITPAILLLPYVHTATDTPVWYTSHLQFSCYRTYILLLLHLYVIHLNCHSLATVRTHSYCATCNIYIAPAILLLPYVHTATSPPVRYTSLLPFSCYHTYTQLLSLLYDINHTCHSLATVRTHNYCPTCTIYNTPAILLLPYIHTATVPPVRYTSQLPFSCYRTYT